VPRGVGGCAKAMHVDVYGTLIILFPLANNRLQGGKVWDELTSFFLIGY